MTVVEDLSWSQSAAMLGCALGAIHAAAAAVAAAAAAASGLPPDFTKTTARWVVSVGAERSPLAARSPETPAGICASAAALAGVLTRSGGSVSTMRIESKHTPRLVGLGGAHTVCLLVQMRQHAKETFLQLFDGISAGPP